MTTTDLEPAAWMYGAEREEPFASFKRWPAGVVAMQCWTETALYTADQLQALIEERDRLRGALEKIAKQDYGYQAVIESGAPPEKHAYYFCSMVNWRRHVARAALAGEKP